MMHIEMTDEEQVLLSQVLERRIRDLEMEILHTDKAEFKAALKQHRARLQGLLAKVSAPLATV